MPICLGQRCGVVNKTSYGTGLIHTVGFSASWLSSNDSCISLASIVAAGVGAAACLLCWFVFRQCGLQDHPLKFFSTTLIFVSMCLRFYTHILAQPEPTLHVHERSESENKKPPP